MSELTWNYIQQNEDLKPLLKAIETVDTIPFDLEADSMHCYKAKICLIQITIAGINFIVDPLAEIDLSPLLKSLQNKTLIIHGSDYDLRMMRDCWNFTPFKVFDTMLAARYLGEIHFGLAALIQKKFAITLDKSSQKAQWSQRPLTDKLLKYAATDTFYLEEVYLEQKEKLLLADRLSWLEEHCKHLQEQISEEVFVEDPDRWRIKGSSALQRRQLALLQNLWLWREGRAAEKDLPPFKILANEKLIELCKNFAGKPEIKAAKLPKMPRNFGPQTQEEIANIINRANKIRMEHLPSRKKRLPPLVPSPHPLIMEKLKNFREALAEELGIDSHLLANKSQLVFLALNLPLNYNDCNESGLMKWQFQLFLDSMMQLRSP